MDAHASMAACMTHAIDGGAAQSRLPCAASEPHQVMRPLLAGLSFASTASFAAPCTLDAQSRPCGGGAAAIDHRGMRGEALRTAHERAHAQLACACISGRAIDAVDE